MNRLEEQDLIAAAQTGNHPAMTRLVSHHQASLYAFMLRLSGRPDVAEDIVQEAFVRVLRNLDRFDTRYRFSTWLFTIAKRLYVNWNQKHRPRSESPLLDGEADRSVPVSGLVADSEERSRERRALAAGLAALGDEQREIVLLFHQQEWSIGAISDYLDMPEGTIKSHLHRARRKMRDAMEAHERQAAATTATAAAATEARIRA